MEQSGELSAALEAANAAAEVIAGHYRQNLAVTLKDDQSPVTVADVEAEHAIREILTSRFPDYGFYGEETGRTQPDATHTWLVDPIDGTKSFVRRYPFFSTQIALMRHGELVLGVSSAPAMNELAWAETGRGAWLDGEPLRISEIDSIDACSLSTGNLKTLASGPRWDAFGRIVARVDRIRGYGDFCHYHLLAAGSIDAVLESDVNILDIAALHVIVTEAGGRFTDLDGRAVDTDTTSVLAANPALHQCLLDAL